MYNIKCEECYSDLIFNHQKTVESCIQDLDYKQNSIQNIQDKWTSSYLLYHCYNCKKEFKFTTEDILKILKVNVATDVMIFRRSEMLKNINPTTIHPDNGLTYCGGCLGVDNKGNCYTDLYKQCTIR